ncbi:MAG: BatD family protein [Gammaproteobacteria bacterium]|nr:BatD family protein [Gammaproteobacteria bacterium]
MNRVRAAMLAIVLALLALSATAAAQEQAEVRIAAGRDDPQWVGAKIPVYLELWTDAMSFSNQSFVVPEVSGAWLLQTDSSTVKLSERREGATWQGLRYTLSLYAQRAGTLEVPSFDVRFSTRAVFNADPVMHEFTTQSLEVEARLPPGLAEAGSLVTTSAFDFEGAWEPALDDDQDVLELQTGDALVLTVKRVAKDVPGMAFSPLPEMEIEGLGIYADPPRIDDQVDRGDLTGTRADRVTVVCEQPGSYVLPALEFQWWDPGRETLRRETVAAVMLNVTENAAWGSAGSDAVEDVESSSLRSWWWVPVLGVLLWWPGRVLFGVLTRWLARSLGPRRLQPLNPGGGGS